MRLYRHWASAETIATDATGRKLKIRKWDGSNDDQAAARAAAENAVRSLAARLASLDVGGVGRDKQYFYSTRGYPEELIGEPNETAGVTRNRYGALVLNAREAVFVDVDLRLGRGFFARLFGKGEENFLKKLEQFIAERTRQGRSSAARVYRTAAGLRYLLTDAPQRVGEETVGLMQRLGSDKLYMTLCRAQDCYRARLTPKPWRIKVKRPPHLYPREGAQQEREFRDWLADYEAKSSGFAVCKYLRTIGDAPIHSSLAALVKEHDRATRADSDLPLA